MLRILHTSDWHLGHSLKDLSREREHALFFEFLYAVLREQAVDVLLVAGDVFETANPSAAAQNAWYEFLATAHRRFPSLDIVVIGGNHDSAARLDAPNPLIQGLGSAARGGGRVHVLGGLPRKPDGRLDLARLVVPVRNAHGVAAWVCAVPFLRPADLPRPDPEHQRYPGDELIDGVWRIYEEVLAAARSRRDPAHALVTMGHCFMSGGAISELSERKILGGNQHALPVAMFPDDVAYVALGHLHKAQAVGAPHVRYSGSPIPLSLGERNYEHQVLLVELDGPNFVRARPIEVPRRIQILRIPDALPYETPERVLELIAELPDTPGLDELDELALSANERPVDSRGGQLTLLGAEPSVATAPLAPPPSTVGAPIDRPLLEVQVLLLEPDPNLRRRIMEALEGKLVRLAKLEVTVKEGPAQVARPLEQNLRDLEPEDVFRRCYARTFNADPDDEVLRAFAELIDVVHQGDDA